MLTGHDETTEGTVGDPLSLVDRMTPERVLVYGDAGAGSDLDLLVRPAAERALRDGLAAAGYLDLGRWLVRAHDEGCAIVELTPAGEWGLASGELERLFAEAMPLEMRERVVVPAPHDSLLILARRAIYERRPEHAIRETATRALASDPDAFREARASAAAWSAERALDVVERVMGGSRAGRIARGQAAAGRTRGDGGGVGKSLAEGIRVALPRARRRGVLIALSGLDGAGKSTLAAPLADLSEGFGARATVIWSSLSQHPRWLHRLADTVRALLFTSRRGTRTATGEGASEARKAAGARLRERSSALTFAWTTLVTVRLALALARSTWPRLLRGEVVICDRYTLDSWVQLGHRYGAGRSYDLQVRLLRALTPEPDLAYFLDTPPEVASERKLDFTTEENERRAALYRERFAELGIRRLDGTRPRSQHLALIAAALAAELR